MSEKIHQAIVNIMRAVGPIAKDRQNTQQRYNFRGIDDVYNACHPHFAEHGVYSTSEVLDAKTDTSVTGKGQTVTRAVLHMRFTFHAEDGSSVSTEVIGEGIDYGGDKAHNKAMSVADKYAILQLLKIPTAMVDPDATTPASPPTAGEAPTAAPRGQRVTKDDVRSVYKLWETQNEPFDDSVSQKDKLTLWLADVRDYTGKPALTQEAAEWSTGDLEKCVNRLSRGNK